MKFLSLKTLEHSTLLKTLSWVSQHALFYTCCLILNFMVISSDVIFTTSNTLYGDAENFIEPILIDTLLLQVHIDLFMSLFALMMLSAIYIRLFSEERHDKMATTSDVHPWNVGTHNTYTWHIWVHCFLPCG